MGHRRRAGRRPGILKASRYGVPSLLVTDDVWPLLSSRFGITPRDVSVPPEEGGLTYGQLEHYLEALDDVYLLGTVYAARPPR